MQQKQTDLYLLYIHLLQESLSDCKDIKHKNIKSSMR